MRIVHIGKYYSPAVGGMESLVRSHAITQSQLGHQVHVVVVNHRTGTDKDLIGKTFGAARSERDVDGSVTVHRANRFGSLFKCDLSSDFGRSIRRLASTKPDIWHLHTPNATAIVAMQRLLGRCTPLVVSHHSDILNQRLLRSFYEALEARLYRQAKAIISDSTGYIAGSRQLKRFQDKVHVIPIGIDVHSFANRTPEIDSLADQYRAEFSGPVWLCVGRPVQYKGFDVAIRALRDVPGTLLFVGTGPLLATLQKRARDIGVSDRVRFLGYCSPDQLRAHYRSATALWFPSIERNEGFGIAQVEAMASGCPVINTQIPGSGVHEVSVDGVTGFTIPCNDAAALANAARKLLANEELRCAFSENGKKRAREFDNEEVNQRLMKLYGEVMGVG